MSSLHDLGPLAIVGAGPAGSVLAILLAQRGYAVDLYESRMDLRTHSVDAGRSINLALATRGIVALEAAGIGDDVGAITIPMVGRMVHAGGEVTLQPYGTRPHEVIHSVGRSGLNAILLTAAEGTGRVRIHFAHRLRTVDLDNRALGFTVGDDEAVVSRRFGLVFGTDGANSLIRAATLEHNGGSFGEEPLDHGYKELTIPPEPDGGFRLDPNALHIWPGGNFMLIALANPTGDFTATLFLPNQPEVGGEAGSFAELDTAPAVQEFFERHFPDFVDLVPDLTAQFATNPTGALSTIRCNRWSFEDRSVILGDAAHGIVPFHGQGMNAAMESALVLIRHLDDTPDDVAGALARFSDNRKPDADAIADMALDNYVEMRAGVVDPSYLIKRELALELGTRYPDRFTPRYGMVMFTTLPYAEARSRAEAQAGILTELTAGLDDIDEVDFDRAARLVGTLPPLPAEAVRSVGLVEGEVG
jgi:kynurenine 3-monooxygenase